MSFSSLLDGTRVAFYRIAGDVHSPVLQQKGTHMSSKQRIPFHIGRRDFITTSIAGLTAGGLTGIPSARASSSDRPNVLYVFTDQEREGVSRRFLRLPNRMRLEEHGVRFTQAFCTTPQCSASRSSLLTGRYPHEAGVVANVDGNSMGKPLSPDIPSLGNVFSRNGYATGYFGKWHLGNDKDGLDDFGFPGYRRLKGNELAQAAADWIDEQSSQPWFLMVSFNNPHDIYHYPRETDVSVRDGVTIPDNFNDDLKGKPSPQRKFLVDDQGKVTLDWDKQRWLEYRSYYLDLIEKVDGHLGLILDALEKKGQTENTIVVYTSDHGDMGGGHRLPFKGPFMYEELLNVPLVISYPKRLQRVLSNSLVSLVDIVPTLCDLTGVEWPGPLSGTSLCPVFQDPGERVRRVVYSEYYGKQKWAVPIRTIRTRNWKYNTYVNGGEELYDLKADPGETVNLVDNPDRKDVKQRLSKRLQRWRQETEDPLL